MAMARGRREAYRVEVIDDVIAHRSIAGRVGRSNDGDPFGVPIQRLRIRQRHETLHTRTHPQKKN